MDLGLSGTRVLVAGASQGIGQGIADALLEEGAKVLLTGRSPGPLQAAFETFAAQHGDRVAQHAADMTVTEGITGAFAAMEAAFRGVDAVIANVGGGGLKPGWDVSDDDLAYALEQNLTGTVRLAREAMSHLQGREGTSLTVISSIAGVNALGAPHSYGIAKAGLNHFVANLAKEVGPAVRVNSLAPGNILFPGGSWERNVAARPDAWQRWIDREVALKRFGTVREIADVVAFLTSPRAAFVTGATWVVDGGQVKSTA